MASSKVKFTRYWRSSPDEGAFGLREAPPPPKKLEKISSKPPKPPARQSRRNHLHHQSHHWHQPHHIGHRLPVFGRHSKSHRLPELPCIFLSTRLLIDIWVIFFRKLTISLFDFVCRSVLTPQTIIKFSIVHTRYQDRKIRLKNKKSDAGAMLLDRFIFSENLGRVQFLSFILSKKFGNPCSVTRTPLFLSVNITERILNLGRVQFLSFILMRQNPNK